MKTQINLKQTSYFKWTACLVVLSLGISLSTFAESKKHQHHKAHVHGQAEVMIAFDKELGKLELTSPSDSIFGFEHEAKSEKDKKTVESQTKMIEENIQKIFVLAPELNCQWTKDRIIQKLEDDDHEKEDKKHKDHDHHGEHSEVEIVYAVKCTKSPIGTTLTVDLSLLPKIKKASVTVLADQIQLSTNYKGQPTKIELK